MSKIAPMSRTGRNFVVAYIILVGLPLLALAAVLRSGRNLSAPISVDGTWKIEDSGLAASQPCVLSTGPNVALQISQSGKSLIVSYGNAKTADPGRIDGTGVKAVLISDAKDCGPDHSLTLTATVNPQSDPRSLTGTIVASGCSACAPAEFRAVRLPRPQSGGLR